MPDYKNSDMCNAIQEYVRNPRYKYLLQLRFHFLCKVNKITYFNKFWLDKDYPSML